MKHFKKHFTRNLIFLFLALLCACSNEENTEPQSPTPSPSTTPQAEQPTSSPKPNENTIAQASTKIYDQIPERTKNLHLAIQAINGTVLQPGEEFSFNAIVGDRTEEKGYQKATGYDEKGEKKKVIGGGICQISSTLHIAALNGNYDITERHPHSHEVPYTDSDHDATVSYGGYDFKFRNNRDKPIEVSVSTDGKNVLAAINELEASP